ncbi:MAG: hypothetical protein Q7U73_06015 [Rubrivivax sp.]|nr:hypothetical protein [Rubrivivax sp.]
MRRLLMFCLLVMLPFQGAWSAVSGIAALDAPCATSQQASLHGGHAGDGDAAADAPGAMIDCDGFMPAEACDGSCSNCHGHVLVAMISLPVALGDTGTGDVVLTCNVGGAPDHIPEHPLRPPLSSRA